MEKKIKITHILLSPLIFWHWSHLAAVLLLLLHLLLALLSGSCASFKCILRLSFVFIKSKVSLFRVVVWQVCPDTHPREKSTNISKLQLPKSYLFFSFFRTQVSKKYSAKLINFFYIQ